MPGIAGRIGDHLRLDLVQPGEGVGHARSALQRHALADEIELAGIGTLRAHHVIASELQIAIDRIDLRLPVAVVARADRSAAVGDDLRREARGAEEGADLGGVAFDVVLHRRKVGAFAAEADRPGGEIGGDVALGKAAHGDGAVGHPGAPEAIAEQIAADDDAKAENGRGDERGSVAAQDFSH